MDFNVGRALESFTTLTDTLEGLTAEQVTACLELESGSRRRKSIIDRLISRAVRLNELEFRHQLEEKYL